MKIGTHGKFSNSILKLFKEINENEIVKLEENPKALCDVYFINCEHYDDLKPTLKPFVGLTKSPFYILNLTIPKYLDHLTKFYKLKLYTCCFNEDLKTALLGSKENTIEIDRLFLLRGIFYETKWVMNVIENRALEMYRNFNEVLNGFKKVFQASIAKYCKRISCETGSVLTLLDIAGCPRDEKDLYGFGGSDQLNAISNLVAEMKRLGLQTGILDAMFQENMIYRCAFEKDLPSLEINMHPKTKEAIFGPDNKALL